MKVDFHVHSTASDGTVAPGDLARAADAHGYAALALTDHDNCDGIAEFVGAARGPAAARRVAGVELSIEPGKGFDKFHLLALGIDPANDGLKAFLRRILDGRNARNARIIANFNRLGIPMQAGTGDARDDILLYAHGEVLARPHFARWLMVHGYAASIKAAFANYLLPDSPVETRCYEERYHPSQEEAFAVVHAAGGLCVMAHPKFWRTTWKYEGSDFPAAEKELRRLKEAGLDGLEARYQANSPCEDVNYTLIADRVGLLKTAGSDFHGANKPTIPLGMEVEEAFIAPFLEALPRQATGAAPTRQGGGTE